MTLTQRVRNLLILCIFTLATACGGGGGGGGGGDGANTPNTPPVSDSPAPLTGFNRPEDLGDGWQIEEDSPLDQQRLDDLFTAIAENRFPNLDALAVAHQGQLIVDYTHREVLDRFDEDVSNQNLSMHLQFSISKSLAAILVGIAIDQDDLAGVDQPYLSLFDYPDYAHLDERKRAMTLGDVLSMRLGLQWDEMNPDYSQTDNQLFSLQRNSTDWTKALLDLPMAAEPGEEFAYNTVATTSLGQAIENIQPLMLVDYVAQYLLGPLGISDVEVLRTPTELPDLGRGVYLTSRDLLKFGELVRSKGRWNNQVVVSEDWIEEMLKVRTEMAWRVPEAFSWQVEGYGYQWWVGHYLVGERKITAYAARGFGLQVLMIVPELGLVIAVNSHGYDIDANEEEVFGMIGDYLIPAVVYAE